MGSGRNSQILRELTKRCTNRRGSSSLSYHGTPTAQNAHAGKGIRLWKVGSGSAGPAGIKILDWAAHLRAGRRCAHVFVYYVFSLFKLLTPLRFFVYIGPEDMNMEATTSPQVFAFGAGLKFIWSQWLFNIFSYVYCRPSSKSSTRLEVSRSRQSARWMVRRRKPYSRYNRYCPRPDVLDLLL